MDSHLATTTTTAYSYNAYPAESCLQQRLQYGCNRHVLLFRGIAREALSPHHPHHVIMVYATFQLDSMVFIEEDVKVFRMDETVTLMADGRHAVSVKYQTYTTWTISDETAYVAGRYAALCEAYDLQPCPPYDRDVEDILFTVDGRLNLDWVRETLSQNPSDDGHDNSDDDGETLEDRCSSTDSLSCTAAH